MLYRVFSEDVGARRFSAVQDVYASNPEQAVLPFCTNKKMKTWHGQLVIALPHDRKDLWPHPTRGTVPNEALTYR